MFRTAPKRHQDRKRTSHKTTSRKNVLIINMGW